jgi:DNA-binding LacI/PurR family transcriptional regulator
VHIPRARIGHIISEHLLPKTQKSSAADVEVVIDPEFLVRDSTGPAPGR